MKRLSYSAIVAAGIMTMSMPLLASAQTAVDTGASAGIGASVDANQGTVPLKLRDSIRTKIQADYNTRMENVRNNEDYRNSVLDKRAASATNEGTSTRFVRPAMMVRIASSTDREFREHREIIRVGMFAWMRDRIVDQLVRALGNLNQIRSRVATRIALESQNGKDMSAASRLLASADAKLKTASSSIEALKAYVPTATTTAQVTASTTIEIAKAREIGAGAIKAINDARKALTDTVAAIAKALGVTIEHSSAPDRK